MCDRARPERFPVRDRAVEGLDGEVDRPLSGGQVHHDVGVLLLKLGQPRNEPARAEGRQHGEIDDAVAVAEGHDLPGRGGELIERLLDAVEIHLACVGEHDALAHALEQRDPQLRLEQPDLPADRALRQIELARRPREAAVLRGAYERDQFPGRRDLPPLHCRPLRNQRLFAYRACVKQVECIFI